MDSNIKHNIQVSVIIVNYKTAEMVLAAVDSIVNHTHDLCCEIIVVDNNSGLEQLSTLQNDKRFQLLALKENLGFGRANNEGAKIAQGENLLFLNPDTLLRNNAIGILHRYMQDHPECGIAGGNLYDAKGHPCHSFHHMLPSIGSEMDFATRQIYRRLRYGRSMQFNYSNHPLRVAMITGADMMIRKKLYDKVGGFDERFFMYCEDADLCKRIMDEGYTIISVPEAEITHLEGQSFEVNDVRVRRTLEGRKCYFNKHYSACYCRWADRLNIITLMIAGILNKRYQQRLKIYREIARQ